MKIYEIGTGYTPIPAKMGAATEIVVEELTKSLINQGHAVEIIDIAADDRATNTLPIKEVKVPKKFSETDVSLGIMHKLKRVVYSIKLAKALKKILKETDEKVVFHFHNQYNMYFFLKLSSKKLRKKCFMAYTNHSGIWRLDWQEIEQTINKRYFQEAKCMKSADVVFVLNEDTMKNASKQLQIPEDHFVVISNGVNIDNYIPFDEYKRAKAKDNLGLKGKRVILQVGSVYENKGQKRSLELLLPLMKKNENLVFAYAGGIVSQEYQDEITAYAKEQGVSQQVKYFGIVCPGKDLNYMYNVADATIFSSEYEGFSLVIIESMSAGTPVIMSSESEFSVGAGCIQYKKAEFCKCMEENIFDKENLQKNSEDARKNAIENFSWDKIATDYVTAINNLIRKDNLL